MPTFKSPPDMDAGGGPAMWLWLLQSPVCFSNDIFWLCLRGTQAPLGGLLLVPAPSDALSQGGEGFVSSTERGGWPGILALPWPVQSSYSSQRLQDHVCHVQEPYSNRHFSWHVLDCAFSLSCPTTFWLQHDSPELLAQGCTLGWLLVRRKSAASLPSC